MCAKTTRLSSLTYGIVRINKRVTCTTNEVLTSKHDCVFHLFAYGLHLPQQLANCELFAQSCSNTPDVTLILEAPFIVVNNLIVCLNNPSALVNCVKIGPPSLKSLCVNKLNEIKSKNNSMCLRK